jgi:hypothetical protein
MYNFDISGKLSYLFLPGFKSVLISLPVSLIPTLIKNYIFILFPRRITHLQALQIPLAFTLFQTLIPSFYTALPVTLGKAIFVSILITTVITTSIDVFKKPILLHYS